eukprot:RCo033153
MDGSRYGGENLLVSDWEQRFCAPLLAGEGVITDSCHQKLHCCASGGVLHFLWLPRRWRTPLVPSAICVTSFHHTSLSFFIFVFTPAVGMTFSASLFPLDASSACVGCSRPFPLQSDRMGEVLGAHTLAEETISKSFMLYSLSLSSDEFCVLGSVY